MNNTIIITPANREKYDQAIRFWQQVLEESLQRGFFGTVLVELKVNDGTIQHVRRQVEQVEK
jgi:hypothetical protein